MKRLTDSGVTVKCVVIQFHMLESKKHSLSASHAQHSRTITWSLKRVAKKRLDPISGEVEDPVGHGANIPPVFLWHFRRDVHSVSHHSVSLAKM